MSVFFRVEDIVFNIAQVTKIYVEDNILNIITTNGDMTTFRCINDIRARALLSEILDEISQDYTPSFSVDDN